MKKKIAELTLEELLKKQKLIKNVLRACLLVMLVSIIILLFTIYKSKNFILLVLFPACIFPILPLLISYGQINTEIKNRKQ